MSDDEWITEYERRKVYAPNLLVLLIFFHNCTCPYFLGACMQGGRVARLQQGKRLHTKVRRWEKRPKIADTQTKSAVG